MVPDDFATIYDVTPLYAAGIDGAGQSLVIVGQTDINVSDIDAFRSKYNLPAINLQQHLVQGQADPGISQAICRRPIWTWNGRARWRETQPSFS